MVRAPDKFFKKKNIFILTAHGGEERDVGRYPLPQNAYVALPRNCGTILYGTEAHMKSLYEYNKQILIPKSLSNVARSELTLNIHGEESNELENTVTKKQVNYKVYMPHITGNPFKLQYNTLPPLVAQPFLIYINPTTDDVHFSHHYPTSLSSFSYKPGAIYITINISGVHSKSVYPHIPKFSKILASSIYQNAGETKLFPKYYKDGIRTAIPSPHYTLTFKGIVHLYFIQSLIFALKSATHSSLLSFEDICLYGLLNYNLVHHTKPITYDTFVQIKHTYGPEFQADMDIIETSFNTSQPSGAYLDVKSPVWNMTIKQLLHISIPLKFIIEYIQAKYSKSEPMMLLGSLCRSMGCSNINTSSGNTSRLNALKCAIRTRRNISRRSPVPSSRPTHRRRYKWRNKTSKTPESAPLSPTGSTNSGYGNYTGLPGRLYSWSDNA